MTGLLADGWFYISTAGLLVSGVLFFFLLGQYRAAGDAADQNEPEAAAEPHVAVRPVWTAPNEPAASPRLASSDKPEENAPAAAAPQVSAPKAETPTQAEKRRENTTGGVNPAVVYLQNIKTQLELLHVETRDLAKRVDAITGRDEALIERLSELAQAVAEIRGAAPATAAPAEAAVAKRAKKTEAAAPAPVVVAIPVTPPTLTIEPSTSSGVPRSAPETKPDAAPVAKKEPSPDATIRMDLDAAIQTQLSATTSKPAAEPAPAAEAAPAPSTSSEDSEPEKPRRGPVWPV